ncbi:MAG: PQQ-binding-like beta-propeller repeat protein [Acidobacteriota bacterium]|nr:PQQ-binding-like beta-propeller repeat protein [Acidobacteriota bacterium]
MKKILVGIAVGWLVTAGVAPSAAQDGAPSGEWVSYHGDKGSTQYTALDQIDASNVNKLAVEWTWASPDNDVVGTDRRMMPRGYKSTPLLVDGRLFVNTSMGFVAAIDGKGGETLWTFDTKSREAGRPTNLGFNSRGVAYWRDGEVERIFQPSGDATLWAIDAKTGKPVEGFGDGGQVDVVAAMRREVNRRNVTIMSSPLVVGDVVIVGSSIMDGPTRKEMPPGDVHAFKVRTGELAWTFYNPPLKDTTGYDTWEEGSAEYSGNANVWTNMTADTELGLVYLPFGTPTNDWYGGHRPGDNYFAESIVCVKADTGELVWHYQLIHHGLWDYDIPAAPTLFDTVIDGKPVKGVAVVTKQAFTYVFDRVTGEPIWPIEERPVPQSDVPGERSAATQPFPTKPPAFDYQGDIRDVLIDFTPQLKAEAEEILEQFTVGPMFMPPTVISETNQGTVQLPGWGGGASWSGAGFDPENGYLYVPSFTGPISVGLREPDAARSNFRYVRCRGAGGFRLAGPQGLPLTKPPYGRVTAIDLKTGEIAWQVPNGDGIRQKLIDMGIPDPGAVGAAGFGCGPLVTKTLLFLCQGSLPVAFGGTGGPSHLRAFDKKTGEVVHEMPIEQNLSATPMSYMLDGKQYIAMAYGSGQDAGLMAITLP